MSEALEQNQTEQSEPERPDFKPNYLLAFVSLLLYKQGGTEAIKLERLEQFDPESGPDAYYDRDKQAWVLKLKKGDSPVIVPVGGKILRRQRKILRGRLS